MQLTDPFDGNKNYFGSFDEGNSDDGYVIEWPNLAISVGDAEAYLKELECPASSSS